jgi:hypothetical protein
MAHLHGLLAQWQLWLSASDAGAWIVLIALGR